MGRAMAQGQGQNGYHEMNYIEDQIAGKSHEWIEGFVEGLKAFAHWKDGEKHVDSCGTTLKSVMAEIHNYTQNHPRNYKVNP